MVDTLFIYLDYSLGRGNASSKENAQKGKANRLYGSMRSAWIFVWNFVCSSASPFLWIEF